MFCLPAAQLQVSGSTKRRSFRRSLCEPKSCSGVAAELQGKRSASKAKATKAKVRPVESRESNHLGDEAVCWGSFVAYGPW